MPRLVRTALLAALSALLGPQAAQAEKITQAGLLERLIDVDRLTSPPPAREQSWLFSSYDRDSETVRDGRYVNWAANDDAGHFLATTDDGWNVLATLAAPGAYTRLWVDQPAGRVRIRIDGKTVIEEEFARLFDGTVEPFGEPLSYFVDAPRGAVLYFPIGFAERGSIQTRDFEGAYQVDSVTFAPDTEVQPFTTQLDDQARGALERVRKFFRDGLAESDLVAQRTITVAAQQDLGPGEKLVEQFEQGSTIRALHVATTDRTEPREQYALHNFVLRMYWDGRQEPDVEAPLTAFFGAGFERNPYHSLVMTTDNWMEFPGQFMTESWFMSCYFPMPFSDGARIEIVNHNDDRKPIGLMFYLRADRNPPHPQALRFKARFNAGNPARVFDFPVLQTTGRGRLVGTVLNIDTPRKDWWGDGDHKIWIDGEGWPSHFGTDTAGYFGNVKGLVRFDRALHGATLVNEYAKNSLYRWHLADSVSFQQSIRFALENWQKNGAQDVYYGTMVYWYGEPGAEASFEPISDATLALPGLRIPGAVEAEDTLVGSDWGNVLKQKYARPVTEFSGEAAAVISTAEPVEARLPIPGDGTYRLSLRVHPRRSFETIEVTLPDGNAIGTVTYDRAAEGKYVVGKLPAGPKRELRILLKCSTSVCLDCFVLEPVED